MWTIYITKEKDELKILSDVKWPLEGFCKCLCMWIILQKLTEVIREYAQEKLLTWMFAWRIRLLLWIFLPRFLKEHYALYVSLPTSLLPPKPLWIVWHKLGTYTWGHTMKPHKIKTFEQEKYVLFCKMQSSRWKKVPGQVKNLKLRINGSVNGAGMVIGRDS